MRTLVLVWLCLSTAVARADALPGPGRPEWSDTPMPMPSGPDAGLVFALVAVMVVAIGALFARRGRSSA